MKNKFNKLVMIYLNTKDLNLFMENNKKSHCVLIDINHKILVH